MDLATMRTRVRNAVKDLDASAYYWTDVEVDAAITRALGEYTLAAPAVASVVRSGDGSTRSFDCASEADYLYALAVEHPIDEDPPRWLKFREIVRGTVVVYGDPPAAGAGNVRVWHAKAHGTAGTWTVPAEDEPTIELGAMAHLALAGARYASGRLNVSQSTPGQLRELGQARRREFEAQLDALRARPVGPQWRPSWDDSQDRQDRTR